MQYTHLTLAILTAISLTACGGSGNANMATSNGASGTNQGVVTNNISGSSGAHGSGSNGTSSGGTSSGGTSSGGTSSGGTSSGGTSSGGTSSGAISNAEIQAPKAVSSAITDGIKKRITVASNGNVDVKPTIVVDKDKGSYDIGINGLAKTHLDKTKFSQFAKVAGIVDGGKQIYLRDLKVTGWKYQTFGQVFDGDDSKGFVSIGKPEDISKASSARYKGIAMGTVDHKSEVAALMTADLNLFDKTLDLTIDQSFISEDNVKNQNYAQAKSAGKYDIKAENIAWDSTERAFIQVSGAKQITAKLFGPNAQEIGGTYQNKIGSESLVGAFGGKRQAPLTPNP